MKIIVTIYNEHQPEGWRETFIQPVINSREEAQQYLERMVHRFNATLRPGEQARAVKAFDLEQLTQRECYDLGFKAYTDGDEPEDCPFSHAGEDREAWLDGFDAAQAEETDDEPEEL